MEKPLELEPLVSIIILNYNGGKTILECIESIYKSNYSKFEIIVIDNGSSDNSNLKCKKNFEKIKLIENEENLGLAARNIGIDNAKGTFIVFLDSDTLVEKNWLKNLLESHEKHGIGLYQPKFLETKFPKIISSAGNMINIFGLSYSIGRGEQDKLQFEKFREINYAPGACTFANLDTMKKIGKVDPIFFAYHDDLDYGWRGLLLGIPSYYEPSSIVHHYGSPTLQWSSKKFYLLERNRWICLLTLYSTSTLVKILPLLIILEIGMTLFFIKKRMFKVKIKAFFSILKLYGKILKRKRQIQSKRKISDEEIIRKFVDDFHLQTTKNGKKSSEKIEKMVIKLSRLGKKLS